MLEENKLNWGWWGKAACTAIYIMNCSPHMSVVDGVLISIFSGKKPNAGYLQIFGSKCFAINTSKNQRKSENRVKECIFLG